MLIDRADCREIDRGQNLVQAVLFEWQSFDKQLREDPEELLILLQSLKGKSVHLDLEVLETQID